MPQGWWRSQRRFDNMVPLRAAVAYCGGGRGASQGGVPSAIVGSVRVQALPLPRLPACWAGCRGPLPVRCGCGCASAGVQQCHLGSQRGEWPSTVVSGVRCQALSLPLPSVLRDGRSVCPGRGGCGRGGPASAPRLSPLWGASGQALPLPRLPAHWAACRGPLPTCCGSGCAAVGAQYCSRGLRALWAPRAAGVVGGRSRGGWPATVVRGVWCQALSLLQPPLLWGGQPGFRNPRVPAAVGAGVETQHQPHSGVVHCGGGRRASPGGMPLAGVGGV